MLMLRTGKISIGNGDGTRLARDHDISSEHCESGREMLARLALYDYDILLIDLDLPDMPGHEAIRLARAAGHSTPCIVLASTDSATWRIKVKALDQGADDIVVMPCDPTELSARVSAVVRRGRIHVESDPRFGPMEISPKRHEVRVNGAPLPVSRREFSVLELMFQKPGVEVSKTALLRHLYVDREEPEMKTIDVIICRLRKKLAVAGVPNLIDTVWGCGYILREPQITVEPAHNSAFASHSQAAA